MIKIHKEPKDMLVELPEKCCICKTPTRMWTMDGMLALCKKCAAKVEEKDLPTREQFLGILETN